MRLTAGNFPFINAGLTLKKVAASMNISATLDLAVACLYWAVAWVIALFERFRVDIPKPKGFGNNWAAPLFDNLIYGQPWASARDAVVKGDGVRLGTTNDGSSAVGCPGRKASDGGRFGGQIKLAQRAPGIQNWQKARGVTWNSAMY